MSIHTLVAIRCGRLGSMHREIAARVMAPAARLVLVDQFSVLLAPTLLFGRRGKARTRRRADRLLDIAGLRPLSWDRLYAVIIQAVVATRQ
jgi:hypothetical protein